MSLLTSKNKARNSEITIISMLLIFLLNYATDLYAANFSIELDYMYAARWLILGIPLNYATR